MLGGAEIPGWMRFERYSSSSTTIVNEPASPTLPDSVPSCSLSLLTNENYKSWKEFGALEEPPYKDHAIRTAKWAGAILAWLDRALECRESRAVSSKRTLLQRIPVQHFSQPFQSRVDVCACWLTPENGPLPNIGRTVPVEKTRSPCPTFRGLNPYGETRNWTLSSTAHEVAGNTVVNGEELGKVIEGLYILTEISMDDWIEATFLRLGIFTGPVSPHSVRKLDVYYERYPYRSQHTFSDLNLLEVWGSIRTF